MKKYLLLTLILFSINLSAQNVFPQYGDNPQWVVARTFFWIPGRVDYITYTIGDEVELTSLIELPDTTYTRDYTYTEVIENGDVVGHYRVEGQKVYFRGREYIYEDLLYNFDMAVNDTTLITYGTSSDIEVSSALKLSEGTLTSLGNEFEYSQMKFGDIFLNMKWIKSIGSDYSPFYPLLCMVSGCEVEHNLWTFELNGEEIYNREFIVSNRELEKPMAIEYRNLGETLEIRNQENKDYTGAIYNLSGQKIIDVDVLRGTNEINISLLPGGIYFVAIRAGEYQSSYKFMK